MSESVSQSVLIPTSLILLVREKERGRGNEPPTITKYVYVKMPEEKKYAIPDNPVQYIQAQIVPLEEGIICRIKPLWRPHCISRYAILSN